MKSLILFLGLLLSLHAKSSIIGLEQNTASQVITETAIKGLRARWSTSEPGNCSMWVREVFQKAFPEYAVPLDVKLFGNSAVHTAAMWRENNLVRSLVYIKNNGGFRPGDVVFQEVGSEGKGHVGIVVQARLGLKVAENTTRYKNALDARALTDINAFGPITGVGRITGFPLAKRHRHHQ